MRSADYFRPRRKILSTFSRLAKKFQINIYTRMSKTLTFNVKAERLLTPEVVCVTGNCPALGEWNVNKVVTLSNGSNDGDLWTVSIDVPETKQIVEYRYAVCVFLESEPDNKRRSVIVKRWEAALEPRKKGLHATNDIDVFGTYNGQTVINKGWLTEESVIQFKLYNNPIHIWPEQYIGKELSVKVSAMNLNPKVNNCDSVLPNVEVATINTDDKIFSKQKEYGQSYLLNDYIVFQAFIVNINKVYYKIDFFLLNDGDSPVSIGCSFILPSVLDSTLKMISVPIFGEYQQPIGQLDVEFVVIKPMSDCECDFKISYSNYWNNRKTVEVGHRGAGNSFHADTKNCADIRENTIGSFKHAANHGADYVEFDVQLSKDLIPILYHDFFVCICTKKKSSATESEYLEIPVKDLSLKQLQGLKLNHVKEKHKNGDVIIKQFKNDDDNDHQPFPTLQNVLEFLDESLGFNVEIKWDMQRENGSHESLNPFELNMYLDIIIKTVFEHSKNRRIVFSCFHPDVCTMIQMKQNKYPVLFLTNGITKKWEPYKDPRTQNIPIAVNFALNSGILGIDVHTEDILNNSSQVKLAIDAGLVMFCWGDDNSDPLVINRLKKLGLHGIIYDKIDVYKKGTEDVFIMETKARQNILESLALM